MPTGTAGLYPKFHGFDADGNPLEGGKLYAYLSGTTTPTALYADPELTTALTQPVVLDASGEALFYTNGTAMKWRLDDANDVPLWTIDPVYGGGSGGAGGLSGAGIGVGTFTVEVTPAVGAAQVGVAVFPPYVLGIALTVWVESSFGVTQGLTHIGIGSPRQPDRWGVLHGAQGQLTAGYESRAGAFLVYSGQPHPLGNEPVTLTAYGGRFDGTGTVYLTGHYLTCTPNHQEGSVYVPGISGEPEPPPPLPLATELSPGIVELIDANEVLANTDLTKAVTIGRLASRTATETRTGLVELATSAETTTGTDTTRATHPAGVKAAIDASGSTTLTGLWTWTTATSGSVASGVLGVNSATYASVTEVRLSYVSAPGGDYKTVLQALRSGDVLSLHTKTDADQILRLRLTSLGTDQGTWISFVVTPLVVGTEAFSAAGQVVVAMSLVATPIATGTAYSVARYSSTAQALESSPVTVDASGNWRLGTAVPGTSAAGILVVSSGTAPSGSHPGSAVQLWVENLEGVAGTASLHIRPQGGALIKMSPSGVLGRAYILVLTTQTTAAPYVLTAEETGKTVVASNSSAMAQATLPAATAGLQFDFIVHVPQGLRVRAAGANTIRLGATGSAAGGAIEVATTGKTLRLVAVNSNVWQVMGEVTGWTLIA